MSLFGALKGKLHKKSLDQEIDEAFGEPGQKEPFSKKVLEANKKLEGENDPEYIKMRTGSSFQQGQESNSLDPSVKLTPMEDQSPQLQSKPPLLDAPLPMRAQAEMTPEMQPAGVAATQGQQLASKIQALQRMYAPHASQQIQHAVPEMTPAEPVSHQTMLPAPSQDLAAQIQELKEQNKNIISILRDIQKNLRI